MRSCVLSEGRKRSNGPESDLDASPDPTPGRPEVDLHARPNPTSEQPRAAFRRCAYRRSIPLGKATEGGRAASGPGGRLAVPHPPSIEIAPSAPERGAGAGPTSRPAQEDPVSERIIERIILAVGVAVTASACQTLVPRELSRGHVAEHGPVEPPSIPAPVRRVPFVPPPAPRAAQETYTVVVHEVPVKELLFALVRDASINADVHPSTEGFVTLNAVDQTLDEILVRITRQLDVRYHRRNGRARDRAGHPGAAQLPDRLRQRGARRAFEQLHRDPGGGRGGGSDEPRQQFVDRHRQPHRATGSGRRSPRRCAASFSAATAAVPVPDLRAAPAIRKERRKAGGRRKAPERS